MLAIRLQRRGRKGLAQFRVIVQESHRSPKSGRVVAHLGSFDPHSKALEIDVEKAEKYLSNGAQPSDRVIKLFTEAKVTLPKWVEASPAKESKIRNQDKLRKNQPAEEAPVEEAAAPAESEEAVAEEAPAKEDAPAEEVAAKEAPAEEAADSKEA